MFIFLNDGLISLKIDDKAGDALSCMELLLSFSVDLHLNHHKV